MLLIICTANFMWFTEVSLYSTYDFPFNCSKENRVHVQVFSQLSKLAIILLAWMHVNTLLGILENYTECCCWKMKQMLLGWLQILVWTDCFLSLPFSLLPLRCHHHCASRPSFSSAPQSAPGSLRMEASKNNQTYFIIVEQSRVLLLHACLELVFPSNMEVRSLVENKLHASKFLIYLMGAELTE